MSILRTRLNSLLLYYPTPSTTTFFNHHNGKWNGAEWAEKGREKIKSKNGQTNGWDIDFDAKADYPSYLHGPKSKSEAEQWRCHVKEFSTQSHHSPTIGVKPVTNKLNSSAEMKLSEMFKDLDEFHDASIHLKNDVGPLSERKTIHAWDQLQGKKSIPQCHWSQTENPQLFLHTFILDLWRASQSQPHQAACLNSSKAFSLP